MRQVGWIMYRREPNLNPYRQRDMIELNLRRITALLALPILLVACASSTNITTASDTPARDGTSADAAASDATRGDAPDNDTTTEQPGEAPQPEPTGPVEPADAAESVDAAEPEEPIDSALPVEPDAGEDIARTDGIIGTANMSGEVVDPQPYPVDGYTILESYPEQIALTFTAGDAGCTAADAAATADGDQVFVSLRVGITTDAMARTCPAQLMQHQLTIPLVEGLNGRSVVMNIATMPTPDANEPPEQDFASTLVGMSATAAEEEAALFGYRWRVMSLDGEQFIGTTDFNEKRVNIAIENGVVVDAWLG